MPWLERHAFRPYTHRAGARSAHCCGARGAVGGVPPSRRWRGGVRPPAPAEDRTFGEVSAW